MQANLLTNGGRLVLLGPAVTLHALGVHEPWEGDAKESDGGGTDGVLPVEHSGELQGRVPGTVVQAHHGAVKMTKGATGGEGGEGIGELGGVASPTSGLLTEVGLVVGVDAVQDCVLEVGGLTLDVHHGAVVVVSGGLTEGGKHGELTTLYQRNERGRKREYKNGMAFQVLTKKEQKN